MEGEQPAEPMVNLRDVLADIDRHIDRERLTTDTVCPRCLNTNTEVIRNEQGHAIGAKTCSH